MTLIRPDLAALPAYVPGKAIPGLVKLASNEVPLPPTPPVLAAIAEAAALGNRYPDLAAVGLTERLARALGVGTERIAVGCGSVSLCQQLVSATCIGPEDEVVPEFILSRVHAWLRPGAVVVSDQHLTLDPAWDLTPVDTRESVAYADLFHVYRRGSRGGGSDG